MRELIDNERDHDHDGSICSISMTPYEDMYLAPGDSFPGKNLNDLQPIPSQIFRLWQIYLDRVNPLTKIIHVPTLQLHFVEATTGSDGLPNNVVALLFAIYVLATVSLPFEECQVMLGVSKDIAL